MNDVKVSLPTLLVITAMASAAAFALGRSTGPQTVMRAEPATAPMPEPPTEAPPLAGTVLPAGHPPVDPNAGLAPAASAESNLAWTVPPSWEVLPNTSSMRIATYRPPRAPGDTADTDVSVTQAGGAITANADRWLGQFDAEGRKTAKKTTKTIAGLEVTIVEVEGTFSGGMGGRTESGWALLGAIVATPGMPHFFKMTGPKKTVTAARKDFDAMLASMAMKS
jgi:hypothetical protein